VFIPEGEAKADHLWAWNIPATHIPKDTKDYAELFREADVVLMPDNDDAGYAHIEMIGAALSGIAKRIRVLRLPDLPDEGDVIDWIAAGGSAKRLLELTEQAPDWMPPLTCEKPDPAKKAAAHADEQNLIDELARLSGLEYDKQRERVARDLGVRKSSLDKEVEGRRAELAAEAEPAPLYPHWVVEPWPEAVDGDALIRDIMHRVRRHVVLTHDQALAVALWILMSWAHSGAEIYSPILMVTSAEANSGKTTLLNVIGFLLPRSMCTVGVTEAVLFRSIERWEPTIIVDEADTLLVHNEPLRTVINSGWTRGSGVPRCIGGDKAPHLFPTFCPKAIGMKGRKLPDTTMSRCIVVEMKRKKPSDRVDHFRHLDDSELANLRRRAQRWTMDNIATLKTAEPELPTGFDNRLGDNWRLMLTIADLAGGEWPDQARHAATAVANLDIQLAVCLSGLGVLNYMDQGICKRGLCFLAILPEAGQTKIMLGGAPDHEEMWRHYFRDTSSLAALEMLESWMVDGSDHWFMTPSAWAAIPHARQRAICDRILEARPLGDNVPFSILDGPRRQIVSFAERQLANGAIPADEVDEVKRIIAEEHEKMEYVAPIANAM
jgi:Protein of unknown function (DUF3631)